MGKDIGSNAKVYLVLFIDRCYRATDSKYVMALISAVFIASAIVCLKSVGLLERVKANTLNVITSVYSLDFSDHVQPENHPALSNTYKLVIDQSLYESVFNQSSPLDRGLLASLVDEIRKSNPRILAIDFDLSPNPRAAESQADELLKSALWKLADEGTDIVLIIPEPVLTAAAIQQKKDWMSALAEHERIRFALSSIYTQDGIVLKYLDACSGFARTIYQLETAATDCQKINQPYHSLEKNVLLPAVQKILPGQDKYRLLINRAWRSAVNEFSVVKAKLQHLNWRFIAFPAENRINPLIEEQSGQYRLSLNSNDQARIFKGLVFLGGDYGLTDYYSTPAGRMAGVDVHVGAYYSIQNPIYNADYLGPFLFEILVGFLLSLGIVGTKKFHSNYPHIVVRIACLLMVFLIMLVLAFIAYQLLVMWNIWINPAPLFLGVILHDLMSYITGEEEETQHKTTEKVFNQHDSFVADFKQKSSFHRSNIVCTGAVYVLVIGYALLYLVSHI